MVVGPVHVAVGGVRGELSYVLPSHLLPIMAKFALHLGWIATADKETAIFVRQGNLLG